MRTRFTLVLALLLCAGPVGAEETCFSCHPEVRLEYEAGIHGERFGCVGCHGGDPEAMQPEQAHASAKGYVGVPKREEIPAMCASCHSDPIRMKAYGLTTDQYAQYETSEHGARLAQGDTRVAVCTDCHGTHRILAPEEPTSPIAPRNIADTCGKCHADREYMAAYSLPTNQVDTYRDSVHGRALYVDNHRSAPTCATCHGAHGAVAPHVGSISAVCGHCHARTREYFSRGPHGKVAAAGAMSECAGCHGYHDTRPADRSLFDKTCPVCHQDGSKPLKVGRKLKTLLDGAEESLALAENDIDRVERIFPTVERYRPRLLQARAHLMEGLPEQHALDVDRLGDHTRQARGLSEDVRAAVHGVEEQMKVRYVWLALAWGFILFAVAVAILRKRERREEGL